MVYKFVKDFYNKHGGEEDELSVEIMQQNFEKLKKELSNPSCLKRSKVCWGYDGNKSICGVAVVTDPKPEYYDDATKFITGLCKSHQDLSDIQLVPALYEMIEKLITQKKRETAEKAGKLLPITGEERYVILTIVGNLNLCMQHIVDSSNLKSHGLELYLKNRETGEYYISSDKGISIKKSALLNAKDQGVMNVLNEFSINFTENQKKEAFYRALEYVEKTSNTTKISTSMDIKTAYHAMVDYAVAHALLEKERGDEESACKFKHDTDTKTIAIRSGHFQKVLDAIDCGYTKAVFCKKLRILEVHENIKIIITNRSQGKGYSYNMTGNNNYYMFYILNI